MRCTPRALVFNAVGPVTSSTSAPCDANARRKLERKNLDYIVLNSLRDAGAGFGVDTNRVTIMSREGNTYSTPLLSKREVAEEIVRHCLAPSCS